ncbi:MAG: hypothetical protein M3R24_05095 [Chloroflexota bacterium]|nr:hypothetical protein [Chloroflexota bacterium]
MTNVLNVAWQQRISATDRKQHASTARFDWAATALSGALVGGAYLDAWAHENGFVDQSFFTPWHGILYGAMLLVGIFLTIPFARNVLRGYHWRQALPLGYGLSLLGVLVFAAGGLGDLIWHTLFGIEEGIEALLSPTHLLLALGWILIVGGPFRAAWRQAASVAQTRPRTLVPAMLSLTWMLATFTFFTIYASPFVHVLAANGAPGGEAATALGVVAFLLQPALLMGVILLAVRRWTLPFGSLLLLLTLNTALVATLHDQYLLIAVAVAAGLLADVLLRWLRPSPVRALAFRVFAAAVPMIVYTLYFGLLLLTAGIGWTTHLWTGTIVLAGAVGLLLSYAFVPPAGPPEAQG